MLVLVDVCIPWLSAKKSRTRGEIVFGEIIDVQHKMPVFSESSSSRCGVRRLRGTKKAAPKGGVKYKPNLYWADYHCAGRT